MAVGFGLGHEIGADRAVGARLVLDQHRLGQQVLEPVSEQAAHEIGRTAGREGDDHADRAGREVLGMAWGLNGNGYDRDHKRGGKLGEVCEHDDPSRHLFSDSLDGPALYCKLPATS